MTIDTRILIRYTFTFPEPFEIDTLEPQYLNIFNNTPENCYWFWRTAPPGDGYSITDDSTGWEESDNNEFDLAYCFTFLPGGETMFPPRVSFEVDGPADVETGCCNFLYTVRNRNAPGLGLDLDEFYVTINKGTGSADCESLADITPPAGWDVEFCDAWNNGQATYRIFGGSLAAQEATFGRIRTAVNGDDPVMVTIRSFEDGSILEQEIEADGIRGWASQSDPAGACGNGTFGPGVGQTGDWDTGTGAICTLEPIPSFTSLVKCC